MIIDTLEEAKTKGYVRITAHWEAGEKPLLPDEWSQIMEDPDEPELLVSDEVRYRRNLRAGTQISLEDLKELILEDQRVKARDFALHLLDFRMRTQKEVSDKLKEKGFPGPVIEETLASLSGYGFLDDAKYAELYLKERISQRGARSIQQELAQKGIQRDITTELLETMTEAEETAALAACEKKIRSLRGRGLDDQKVKEKTYRFLMSRGYDYNMIKKVYNMALETIDPE